MAVQEQQLQATNEAGCGVVCSADRRRRADDVTAIGPTTLNGYRSDIDGLRAVAVLPVILSHADLPFFSGGYVGVDVFFVISGYLITSILLREREAKAYSLRGFYERRARRILPALLLVILVTCPFAWWLMWPDFVQNFGQSVVATLLFANNLLLAKTSGYWELESGFKPLLHTWSLGVEEQFYIVFPLLLAAVWRFGRRWQLAAIGLIGLTSFILAEYGWRTSPASAFYLPTTRAWELMVGCAAAYTSKRTTRLDNLLSGIGLAVILASVVIYDGNTPTPSFHTLIPVLGALAVLLFSHPGTAAYRLLSLPVIVGIGLISYSAYLWHQPLLALVRVASIQPPPPLVMGAMGLLSLGLAWLSWRFVEVPFRSRQRVSWPVFAWPALVVAVLMIAGGLFLHVTQGLPGRIFPNMQSSDDVYIGYNERIREYSAARLAKTDGPQVLVIGNSFARDVANVLLESHAASPTSLAYLASEPLGTDGGLVQSGSLALIQKALVLVFAIHGSDDVNQVTEAIARISRNTSARIVVFGPKHFGWNLNPYGRVPVYERVGVRSVVPRDVVDLNERLNGRLGNVVYVDVLRLLGEDGKVVAIFDELGNPLSADRLHLTRYGAQLMARRLAVMRPDVLELIGGTVGVPDDGDGKWVPNETG